MEQTETAQGVTFKSGKLKSDLFLEAQYSQMLPGHGMRNRKEDSNVPVHEDLKTAFALLKPHMAILCDELKPKGKDLHAWQDDKLDNYTVTGFTIGGSDESEGVTIIGSKKNDYGIVNLNTPFIKYSADEYGFSNQLKRDIENCIYEMEQYLFEGKRAPEAQMAMEFPEEQTPTEV